MAEHDALINLLNSIKKMEQQDIDLIKKIFSIKPVKKNQYFLKAGDNVAEIGFIVKGLFRYFYIDYDGNEKTKYFVTDNEFVFSLSSFIEKSPSLFFIEALSDSLIMTADANKIYDLVDNDKYWQFIYRKLLEHLYVVKEKRESEFLLYTAGDRYANFIKEFPGLHSSVKLHYIASYLGIAPESLSRIRSQMGFS